MICKQITVGQRMKAKATALMPRGSLKIGFDPVTVWLAEPSGKRGRSATFPEQGGSENGRKIVFPTIGRARPGGAGFQQIVARRKGLAVAIPISPAPARCSA